MHKIFKLFQKWSAIFTVIPFFYLITQTDCYEIGKQKKAIKGRHMDSGYVRYSGGRNHILVSHDRSENQWHEWWQKYIGEVTDPTVRPTILSKKGYGNRVPCSCVSHEGRSSLLSRKFPLTISPVRSSLTLLPSTSTPTVPLLNAPPIRQPIPKTLSSRPISPPHISSPDRPPKRCPSKKPFIKLPPQTRTSLPTGPPVVKTSPLPQVTPPPQGMSAFTFIPLQKAISFPIFLTPPPSPPSSRTKSVEYWKKEPHMKRPLTTVPTISQHEYWNKRFFVRPTPPATITRSQDGYWKGGSPVRPTSSTASTRSRDGYWKGGSPVRPTSSTASTRSRDGYWKGGSPVRPTPPATITRSQNGYWKGGSPVRPTSSTASTRSRDGYWKGGSPVRPTSSPPTRPPPPPTPPLTRPPPPPPPPPTRPPTRPPVRPPPPPPPTRPAVRPPPPPPPPPPIRPPVRPPPPPPPPPPRRPPVRPPPPPVRLPVQPPPPEPSFPEQGRSPSSEAQPGTITPLPEDICTPGNDEIPFDFKPLCARTGQKSFCNFPDYYPTKFIEYLNEEYKNSIERLLGDLNKEKQKDINQNRIFKCTEKDACKVEAEIIRPGWVNESGTDNWIIVLNSDKSNHTQEIRTDICSGSVRTCSFISPLSNESCKQMCCTHKLLTAYPCETRRTPKAAAIEFPIPCS